MNETNVTEWINRGITPGELEWCCNNRQLEVLSRRHKITRYELNYLRDRWGLRGKEDELLP